MDGAAVIAAYHDLWKVEASFRLTKSDLKARPIFHHTKDAIEAHLTLVLAALAVVRDLQDRAGISIKKIVQILRDARSATIEINGQHLTIDPELTKPPATCSTGSEMGTNDVAGVRSERHEPSRGVFVMSCSGRWSRQHQPIELSDRPKQKAGCLKPFADSPEFIALIFSWRPNSDLSDPGRLPSFG